MSHIDEALQKSIDLLFELQTPHGFLASVQKVDNYARVFSRDGVIAGIAGLYTDKTELHDTFQNTLETLRDYQDETGRIASNIDAINQKVSYGMSVGRVDATLWYVIGVSVLGLYGKRDVSSFRESVERAIFYLRCLEFNGRGFLYIPHGGDWADEYLNYGYVLFDEMLYYFALHFYGKAFGDEQYVHKVVHLSDLITVNFLLPVHPHPELIYHEPVYKKGAEQRPKPYPLAFFTNHNAGSHIDYFATTLFLLANIADEADQHAMSTKLLADIVEHEQEIIPIFSPVIGKGDPNWKHLESNYQHRFKNEPFCFQNGGRWPLVHGFALSALHDAPRAPKLLEAFAGRLARDGYIFPEYYHGKDFTPQGVSNLGFSAAAYIIAHAAITEHKNIFAL